MRLHYRDPPLVWLFVPAYLALLRAGYQANRRMFQGVMAGLLIHVLVFAMACASARASWQHLPGAV